jgi:hypothetical protein
MRSRQGKGMMTLRALSGYIIRIFEELKIS